MLIAGVLSQDRKTNTVELINSILTSSGKKTSVINTAELNNKESYELKTHFLKSGYDDVDIIILDIDIFSINPQLTDIVSFDIIVHTGRSDDSPEVENDEVILLMQSFFYSLKEDGIAVVNIDDSNLSDYFKGIKRYVVTYGYNSKASITASSIEENVIEESLMCCLQRTITSIDGKTIEPQEYRIILEPSRYDTCNVLAAVTFLVVNGIDLSPKPILINP